MSVFYIEEHNNKFLVKPNLTNAISNYSIITGSWNVFCARVMGLSYANYLRMCRDLYGAEIIGKGNRYPVPLFSTKNEAQKLMKILEKRWNIIKEL